MQEKNKWIIFGIVIASVFAAIVLTKEKSILRFENSGISTSLIRMKTNDNVYIKCIFNNAGVLSNSAEQHGISAVVGSIIFRKLNGFSADETALELVKHGIKNLKVNFADDDFEVSFCVLKTQIKDALKFLSEAFSSPKFTKNDLEYVKQGLPHCLNIETSEPIKLLNEKLRAMLYENHNYGKNNTGTAQAISQITADDINRFVKKYFVKNNMSIIFAGDISAVDIAAYTEALTSDLEEGERADDEQFDVSSSNQKIEIINKPNMNDLIGVTFGARTDGLSTIEQAALKILMQGLFGENEGAFFEELRKKNIACDDRVIVEKNKYSTSFSATVFIEKRDFQKYFEFLNAAIKKYQTELRLGNFERIKAFLMKREAIGFISFADVERRMRDKNLPFEKVSYDIVKRIAKKLFANVRIVIIGNDVRLNLRK